MRRSRFRAGRPQIELAFIASVAAVAGCGPAARLPLSAGIGPNPRLPPPTTSLIPTVKVATATGWAGDAKPIAAPGTRVAAFARGLDHPRWLYVLPNGDVLVAETNGPPRPDDNKGIKGWFIKRYQKKAGAAVPSANRITLLRDADGDGVAETRSTLLDRLYSPFGMALVGNVLYVANSDAVVRFPYKEGDTRITAPAVKVVDLPAGRINHHWTKNLVANADGSTLYVSVGSNSNVGENGLEAERDRAAIWAVDPNTGAHRVFASGLRNPVGMAWETETGALWAAVNERDELGSDLVPDYMTAVRDGGFYGFPFSYYGQHVDERVRQRRPDLVARWATGGHVGRASGRAFDTRRDLAYPPYDAVTFDVPVLSEGDVNARVWVRIREVETSIRLVTEWLNSLPAGPTQIAVPVATAPREGVAMVEAFRGDVLVWLRIAAGGRIARCHVRDASWFQWPLLEAAIEGNIVADFPLCNKSFNCSYSGHDV